MAFRTNKVPAIEERTVNGSSVSFNSAFALPLKACNVSFSATQAGSGDPSPSNPRAISGVSAIGLTANSTPVSVSLGEERFGGELDVLTGVLTITHGKYIFDGSVEPSSVNWRPQANSVGCYWNDLFTFNPPPNIGTPTNAISDKLATVPYDQLYSNDIDSFAFYKPTTIYRVLIRITDLTLTTKEAVVDYLTHNPITVVYELEIPITIQLSANELSSIIGNNTFSTDTGTLEITFSDLQEKSASGAVASFNTALAMPLASCNIGVNAWQEGSGDPNPIDNVRPIHGFSEVNATMAGKNLFDINNPLITAVNSIYLRTYSPIIEDNKIYNGGIVGVTAGGGITIPAIEGAQYTISCIINGENASGTIRAVTIDADGVWTSNQLLETNVNGNVGQRISRTVIMPSGYTHLFTSFYSANKYGSYETDFQIEVGSEATAYEPYVTPTIYTIQLGQEVYGAEVDVVNGVAHVTHAYIVLDETVEPNYVNWRPNASSVAWTYPLSVANVKKYGGNVMPNVISDKYATVTYYQFYSGTTNQISVHTDGTYGLIVRSTDTSLTTKNAILAYLEDNPIQVVYELATPFDIQLTPTQIETLIGNNTIFADTGDIDLTYKDLDIAKRGSFREVFKLPS